MQKHFYKTGKAGSELKGKLMKLSSEAQAPFAPLYRALKSLSSPERSSKRQWNLSKLTSSRACCAMPPSENESSVPQDASKRESESSSGRPTPPTQLSSFSITNIQTYRLRSQFTAWGLAPKNVTIEGPDGVTTIHMWAPDPNRAVQQPSLVSMLSVTARPPTPVGSRPNLVLIHGFGANALWQWNLQLPKLAPHFNLYIPDLVFFGGSNSTSSRRSEIFQAECLAKALEKLGVDRFDVVGISYGGLVAYRIASIFESRVRRVVLTDSPGPVMQKEDYDRILESHGVSDISDLLLPTSPEGIKKLMGIAYYWQLPFPNFILRDVLENLMSDMVEEKRQLLDELHKYLDHPQETPKLHQETLLIWGEFDTIFPLPLAQRLVKFLEPNAQLKVIKNGAHMPNAEHPQIYNQYLLDFLLSPDTNALATQSLAQSSVAGTSQSNK